MIGQYTFAELQAVSYSVTREKAPIYTLGSSDVRSFSRNKRGIAGSLIWINFDRHGLLSLVHKMRGTYIANVDDIRPQFPATDKCPFCVAELDLQPGDSRRSLLPDLKSAAAKPGSKTALAAPGAGLGRLRVVVLAQGESVSRSLRCYWVIGWLVSGAGITECCCGWVLGRAICGSGVCCLEGYMAGMGCIYI